MGFPKSRCRPDRTLYRAAKDFVAVFHDHAHTQAQTPDYAHPKQSDCDGHLEPGDNAGKTRPCLQHVKNCPIGWDCDYDCATCEGHRERKAK